MDYGVCCSGPRCLEEDKIVHILYICAKCGHAMHSSCGITDGNGVTTCFPCFYEEDHVASHGSGVARAAFSSGAGEDDNVAARGTGVARAASPSGAGEDDHVAGHDSGVAIAASFSGAGDLYFDAVESCLDGSGSSCSQRTTIAVGFGSSVPDCIASPIRTPTNAIDMAFGSPVNAVDLQCNSESNEARLTNTTSKGIRGRGRGRGRGRSNTNSTSARSRSSSTSGRGRSNSIRGRSNVSRGRGRCSSSTGHSIKTHATSTSISKSNAALTEASEEDPYSTFRPNSRTPYIPAALRTQSCWNLLPRNESEYTTFCFQNTANQHVLKGRCKMFVDGFRHGFSHKLHLHSLESTEVNIFSLLLGSALDSILEFTNESMRLRKLQLVRPAEFRQFLGTMFLSSSFNASVPNTWKMMELISENKCMCRERYNWL